MEGPLYKKITVCRTCLLFVAPSCFDMDTGRDHIHTTFVTDYKSCTISDINDIHVTVHTVYGKRETVSDVYVQYRASSRCMVPDILGNELLEVSFSELLCCATHRWQIVVRGKTTLDTNPFFPRDPGLCPG